MESIKTPEHGLALHLIAVIWIMSLLHPAHNNSKDNKNEFTIQCFLSTATAALWSELLELTDCWVSACLNGVNAGPAPEIWAPQPV
jgi:hypothetical protein